MATEFICTLNLSGETHSTFESWEADTQADLTAADTRVFSHAGINGSLFPGYAVEKASNPSVTAVVAFATDSSIHGGIVQSQILLKNITGGTFQSGDRVRRVGFPADFVDLTNNGDSAIVVLEVHKDQGPINEAVAIAGATTSAANYRVIRAAAGSRHQGIPGAGVILDRGNPPGNFTVAISENFARVEDIEIRNFGNSSFANMGVWFSNTSQSRVKNLIVHNTSIGSEGRAIHAHTGDTVSGVKIINCMVYTSFTGIRSENAGAGNVYNNTVFNCNKGIRGSENEWKNNISLGSVTNWEVSGTPTGGHNAGASGDTIPGTSNVTTTPGQEFVSTTSGAEDLHLKSGAASIDAGENLSSIFTDDIDGNIRPSTGPWDIGADELVLKFIPDHPVYRGVGRGVLTGVA